MTKKAAYQDYGTLVDHLLVRKSAKGQQVFMIASNGSSEGKTTTSINLAKALAKSGQQTLLLDLNFLKPEIGNILGASGSAQEDTSDPLRPQNCGENLWIFPGAASATEDIKRMFLDPEQGKKTMTVFKNEFDFLLLDTTSSENNLYTQYLGDLADAALIVVKAYSTAPDEVSALVRKLEESNIESIGLILNDRKEFVPRILRKILLGL